MIECDNGEEREGTVFVAGMYGFTWVGPEWGGDRNSVYCAPTKVGAGEKVCRGPLDDESSETCWVALLAYIYVNRMGRNKGDALGTHVDLVERAGDKIRRFVIRY